VAAAAEAETAVSAAFAARASSAGIAEPHNAALAMVTGFTGADIDADFVALVAQQARTIGAEQAAAATVRANEAITAAERAATAAQNANAQVRPAFAAAAAAARSAADAAEYAAEAKRAAADAAADGAAARAASASAGRADAQARDDARLARGAANEAAKDAAIAGRSAAAAQQDADRAAGAARSAESDARAARAAATAAEADATAAGKAAASAQAHADSAADAAANALQNAIEAQAAADRAEQAERDRRNQAIADTAAGLPGPPPPPADTLSVLSPEEQERYRQAEAMAGQSVLDFLREEAFQLFLDISGVGDVYSCIAEGNIEACLWTLVGLLPIGKIFGAIADLIRLVPKLLRFLDDVRAARRTLDDLNIKATETQACPLVPNSFPPGTPVLLADRSRKPIEDVDVGDVVLATDPVSGQTAPRRVTDLITGRGAKTLVDITIDTDGPRGDRTAVLTATDLHPFWLPGRRRWEAAAALRSGQDLRTASGRPVRIVAVRQRVVDTVVHNLTVAEIHTFYVLARNTPVLVHNACNPKSGHTPAAYNGTVIHGDFSTFLNRFGNGYRGARQLPNGTRIDGEFFDPQWGTWVPIELKPNTWAQKRRGWAQLEGYEKEMGAPPGSGQIWTYEVKNGLVYYSRYV
jgi:hypothetical protein